MAGYRQWLAQAMATKGMLDPSQLEFLWHLSADAPDGLAVEVGVFFGRSLIVIAGARAQARGKVIGVDVWQRRGSEQMLAVRHRLDEVGLGYVDLLTATGVDAAPLMPEQVAFVFIDADHSIRGIGRDILVWPDVVKPGGIIAFHDYGVWKPSVAVKGVVDPWQAEARWEPMEPMGQVGAVIAFRRPVK